MPSFNDFAPLYDFSQIEIAMQDLFAATDVYVAPPDETSDDREDWVPPVGVIPFMTAFQADVFTKCNPRVSCSLNGIVPASNPPPMVVDANYLFRVRAWRGVLDFTVITPANYYTHTQLRCQVQSIIAGAVPATSNLAVIGTTGINQYLDVHEVATILDAGNSTGIHQEKAFYGSQLRYEITFAIQQAKWPGGFNPTN